MHNNFFYYINYAPVHVSGTHVPIFRGINYTFTTTGSISVSFGDRTVGRLVNDTWAHGCPKHVEEHS